MTESTFWILTALAGGTRHGYAILHDVETLSGGGVTLRVTTLYASLERLERAGHVARAGEEIVDGRARRYYALTAEGRDELEAETARLQARVRAVTPRLAMPRPGFAPSTAIGFPA